MTVKTAISSKVHMLPPSPKGKLLSGNLDAFRNNPLEFLPECARLGGDIVYLNLPSMPAYLVNHPDYIERILVSDQRSFAKGEKMRNTIKSVLGNGLFTSDGEFWLRQRRLAQPAFHRQRINGYGQVMTNYAQQLGQQWQAGETRDIALDMSTLTMQIVAKALFDLDTAYEATRIGEIFEEIVKSYDGRMRSLVLQMLPETLPFPTNLRYRQAVAELDKIVYQLIEQRRKSGLDKGDLLSMLIMARDDDGNPMTDQQLRDEVVTLVLAGHETTALTLAWAWAFLAQNPEVEAKFHAELERVLGGRMPTVEDLPQLVYTDQLVKETLRVRPPVWLFVREVVKDYELGGYLLPKGSTIFMSQWLLHHDPRFYDEPQKFDPERWTPEMQKKLHKYAYIPFSSGPRLCIGNNFALMEVSLVLATLAQTFRLELAPGEKAVVWPSTLTLRVKDGLKMVVKPR